MTAIVAFSTMALLTVVALIDSVLWKSLPYPEPDRLVRIWETQEGDSQVNPAKGNLADFRHSEAFSGVAGWYVAPRTVLSSELVEVLEAAQVSKDFFPLLGVDPLRGRTFTAAEVEAAVYNGANGFEGSDPVVVISHRLWQRLGGDVGDHEDHVVGRVLTIDRRDWRIIGVLPADFTFPRRGIDLWLPWSFAGDPPRDQRYLEAAGRLADGISAEQASDDLARIARDLGRRFPDTNAGWSARAEPLHQTLVGHAEPYLYMIAFGVASLALLATLHLLSLQWVQMSVRTREMDVRRALGASDGSLLRSLLVESQIPVAVGVLIGAPLAVLALRSVRLWQSTGLPRIEELALRPEAALWTLVGLLLAGALSGWLPALTHRRSMRNGFASRDLRSAASRGPSNAWAASEVALTLTVLMVAAWAGQTWLRLARVDPGFDAEGVYVAPVLLDTVGYGRGGEGSSRTYYRKVLRELRAVPGIEAAGASTVPPLAFVGPDFARPVWAKGEAEPAGGHLRADVRMATPGYFEAVGIPVVRGRDFGDADDESARSLVIVNQTLAERHWPGEDPVGRHLVIDYSTSGTHPYEIVGVVGDLRARGPRDEPRSEVYLPHAQRPYLVMNLVVRSRLAPSVVAEQIRDVLYRLDPAQPAHSVIPLTDRLSDAMERERMTAWLSMLLGLLALSLSGLGVYSLLSVQVAIERPVLGIRCALGATPRQIVRWIVGRGLRVCLAGFAVGLVLTALTVRALSTWLADVLYGIDPLTPTQFSASASLAILLILAAGVVASWPAARRGASVDPLETLRRT